MTIRIGSRWEKQGTTWTELSITSQRMGGISNATWEQAPLVLTEAETSRSVGREEKIHHLTIPEPSHVPLVQNSEHTVRSRQMPSSELRFVQQNSSTVVKIGRLRRLGGHLWRFLSGPADTRPARAEQATETARGLLCHPASTVTEMTLRRGCLR